MPPRCSVCIHEARPAIDSALVAGQSFRNIAERFGTSATALFRHKAEHIAAALVKAQEASEVAQADSLLDQLRVLQTTTLRILRKAEDANAFIPAIMAIKEARGNLELLAKLLGELDERAQVNMLVAPEWLVARAALIEALRPFPEARTAVAERLAALERPA